MPLTGFQGTFEHLGWFSFRSERIFPFASLMVTINLWVKIRFESHFPTTCVAPVRVPLTTVKGITRGRHISFKVYVSVQLYPVKVDTPSCFSNFWNNSAVIPNEGRRASLLLMYQLKLHGGTIQPRAMPTVHSSYLM